MIAQFGIHFVALVSPVQVPDVPPPPPVVYVAPACNQTVADGTVYCGTSEPPARPAVEEGTPTAEGWTNPLLQSTADTVVIVVDGGYPMETGQAEAEFAGSN